MSGTATEASRWTIYGPAVRGRSCGHCKLCCTLLPVELGEGHKPAGVRCQHLRSAGCGIYPRRPAPCRMWSCRWLMDPDTAALRRPDHSGYVVDVMLDTVLIDGDPIDVIQVWCDPARRDAHRDPALRAYLAAIHARFGFLCIVRWSSREGIVLAPPAASSSGEWQEGSGVLHTEEGMRARLAEVGAQSWRDQLTGETRP